MMEILKEVINLLKNTNNTIHIPFTNPQLSTLMSGSDYLQKYILPSSFVTTREMLKHMLLKKYIKILFYYLIIIILILKMIE